MHRPSDLLRLGSGDDDRQTGSRVQRSRGGRISLRRVAPGAAARTWHDEDVAAIRPDADRPKQPLGGVTGVGRHGDRR